MNIYFQFSCIVTKEKNSCIIWKLSLSEKTQLVFMCLCVCVFKKTKLLLLLKSPQMLF